MSNIDLESLVRNLVEGSTWASKKGKVYTVLLVTNVTVKEHLRDRLAPHVVFINSEGEVFSLDCDTFLRTYRYVDLDQRMALLMERVYQYTAGEYDPLEQQEDSIEPQTEDDLVDDDEPLDFNSVEPETLEPEEETEEQTFVPHEEVKERTATQVPPTFAEQLASQYTNVIDFGRISDDSPNTSTFGGLDQQILNRALTSYTLAPNCLVLEFGVQQPINIESLIEAFGPNGYNHAHLMTQGDDVTWNYLSHIEQKYYNGVLHFVVVLVNYGMPTQNQQCSECDECESNVECDGHEVQEPLLMEPKISVNETPTPVIHDLVYGDGLGELNPEHEQTVELQPSTDSTVEPQAEEQVATEEQPTVEEVIEEHFDDLVQAEDAKVIAHVVPNVAPTQTVGEPIKVDPVEQVDPTAQPKRLMPYDPAFDDFVEVTDLEEQQVTAVTNSVLGK